MLLFKCECGCSFTVKEETITNERKSYWCQNCVTTETIDNQLREMAGGDPKRLEVFKYLYEKIGVALNGETTLHEISTKLLKFKLTLRQIADEDTNE